MHVRCLVLASVVFLAPTLMAADGASPCSANVPECRTAEKVRVDRSTLLPQVPSSNILIVDEGRPFELGDHREMARTLAGDSAVCSEWLMAAQWRQDIIRQNVNEAHFDNCAFQAGAAYVSSQLEEATRSASALSRSRTAAERGDHLADGLLAMGRALHAIQDFYAHSNFVELVDASEPTDRSLAAVSRPSVWTPEGTRTILDLAKAQRLYSGAWPLGKYSCPSKTLPTHGQLSKDSSKTERGKQKPHHAAWGPDLHEVALAFARLSSADFLKTAMPKELADPCGPRFAMLLMQDSRKN
jgi:hypothetical protein